VLGVWLDTAGPFGAFLRIAVLGLFGVAGYAFPVVALYWAVVLFRGTAVEDRGRMLVGLWILALGGLGIASIAGHNPSVAAGYKPLSRAGGMLGALAAWPLSKVVSPYGAVAICLGLCVLGLLVFTATPLAAVGRAMRRAFIKPDAEEGAGAEADAEPDELGRPRRSGARIHLEDAEAVVDMPGFSLG